MGAHHLGPIVDIDHDHGHAGRHQPVDDMVDQRLALPTSTSGLGLSLVSGRMRVPRPAAMIIARRSSGGLTLSCALLRRAPCAQSTRIVPRLQTAQRRMLEIAVQIAPDPRQIAKIARLAIALGQPREDADNLGIALRRRSPPFRPGARFVQGVPWAPLRQDSARHGLRPVRAQRRGARLRSAKRGRSLACRRPRPGNRSRRSAPMPLRSASQSRFCA